MSYFQEASPQPSQVQQIPVAEMVLLQQHSALASNITIQLIKGGSILQSVVNPTSPYTFTNLQPGTDYEVKTVCSNDNQYCIYSANPNITVADHYIPISDATITISDVCTNFTTGGTFL